jgi:predicted nucleotide-binding protein (sugar kinase/HSP70/actin superfamily)
VSEKVNQKTKNGHFFCPFLKSGQGLLKKSVVWLHNEKLASADFLQIFYFVTINFLYFN